MTADEQPHKFPMIKLEEMEMKEDQDGTDEKVNGLKRKCEEVDTGADISVHGCDPPPSKTFKVENLEKVDIGAESTCQATAKVATNIIELTTDDEPCLRGPLLQIPTGSNKVYTRVDLENKAVWKGPYKEDRIRLIMFRHRVLREVFGDTHTLPICRNGLYAKFPLLFSKGADKNVTSKDFHDCIGKQRVTNGQFVERESLGVIQLHKIHPSKIASLPATFWCHYMYRFLLNVGESGLYNSITNSTLSFLFGIDMDEVRHKVAGSDLLDLMFVKLPKKQLCSEIRLAVQRLKPDIMRILNTECDLSKLVALSRFYEITFDRDLLNSKLDKVKNAVDKM